MIRYKQGHEAGIDARDHGEDEHTRPGHADAAKELFSFSVVFSNSY